MAAAEDLVVLKLDDNNNVTVHLHGATLLSWKCDGQEVLFTSNKAVFDNNKAIRGGVPLVFPCFGPWSLGPQHGFARINRWSVETPPTSDGENSRAAFSLVDNEMTRSMWNHRFKLVYSLTLTKSLLEVSLRVVNTGDTQFDFTCLLHTYFSVSDVTMSGVTGLKGCSYYDQLTKENMVEQEDPVVVTANYDRIYKNTPDVHTIMNTTGGRVVTIVKKSLPDTVLWNPWTEKAKAMSDFGDNQYPNMLCVEAGKVAEKQVLAPGDSFVCGQELSVRKGTVGSL